MRTSIVTPTVVIEGALEDPSTPYIPTLVLLRAGSLVPEATRKFGTYHDVFAEFFKNGFKLNHPSSLEDDRPVKLRIISFNVLPSDSEPIEYPSPEILNSSVGLLISGSASNAYDSLEWIDRLIEFSKDLIDHYDHLLLIGICFGHQILSRAFGAKVIKNPLGWELGVHQFQLSGSGLLLFGPRPQQQQPGNDDVELGKASQTRSLNLFQVHQDIVTSLPESTHNIGSSSKCEIQGWIKFRKSESIPALSAAGREHQRDVDFMGLDWNQSRNRIHILTLQGHPEYHSQILIDLLNHRTQSATRFDLIDQSSYQTALDSLTRSHNPSDLHHGSLVASRMLEMLNII